MTGRDRDQSEWLTRKGLIDPKLKSGGWTVVPFDPIASAHIVEYPTDNGPAGYALASLDTRQTLCQAADFALV
jgi:hypothetical protein